ncbi:MAG: hypothetical protein EOP86_16280 [Verrucomicrobiaceae bacterium]|nr:MAG: hypothetical protein EOP86_16280 [Verrucomicrobiaceae bacterium]
MITHVPKGEPLGSGRPKKLDRQPRDRGLRDPDNQRLPDGIGPRHHNGRVPLFLERPEIEPANNHAERGLRRAVIARKVPHCSKNGRGARTCEVMRSITATLCHRQQPADQLLAFYLEMVSGRIRRGTRRERSPERDAGFVMVSCHLIC